MIGRLEKTVIDCPDPRALAAFYAELLGMRVNEDSDDWVVIGRAPGARELAFQRARVFVRPGGPTRGTRSSCTWTSGSTTSTGPNRWC